MRLSEMTKGVLGATVSDLELDDRGRIVALYLAGTYGASGPKIVARSEGYTPCLEIIPAPDPVKDESGESGKEDGS